MLEKTLWNLFLITGDVNIYLYYKNIKKETPETKIRVRVLLDT